MDKDFFKKYQRLLVWFANTKLGAWFFKIDKKINRIGANYIGYDNVLEFRVKPYYAIRLNELFNWLPIQPIKIDWEWYLQPKLGMTTTTFYPNPATGTAGIDGTLYGSPAHTTWANLRGATDATSVDASDNPGFVQLRAVIATNDWDRLHRFACGFDTSSIGSSGNITSATLSLYISATTIGNLTQSIGVTTYAPASNTALATGDYDSFGSTRLATDKTISSITTSAYNDWTLNASGLAAISKTGVTNFMFRPSADIDNVEPSIPGTNPTDDITIVTSDNAGTGSDPKLVVTYNPPFTTTITDGMIHGDTITTIRTRFATIIDGMIHGDVITATRQKLVTILDGMIHGDTISVTALWSRVQKIVSSWTNLSKATPFLLDSCTATSNSVLQLYNGLDFIGAQSFTGGGKLARAKFNLRKVGSPTGSLNAVLYAHSGTFGNGGAPTGAILATSATTLSAADLTTSSVEYTFDFTDQYQMTTGTYYFIGVYFTSTSSDASNYVGMDRTTVVASHAGNLARYGLHPALNWTSNASDMIFKVYSTFGNLSKNNATWTNQSR